MKESPGGNISVRVTGRDSEIELRKWEGGKAEISLVDCLPLLVPTSQTQTIADEYQNCDAIDRKNHDTINAQLSVLKIQWVGIKVFLNSACLLTQTWSGLNKPREIKNRLTLICMKKGGLMNMICD